MEFCQEPFLAWLFPIPDLGLSVLKIGEGNGNPLQYSCLENPIDRGACLATVHGHQESDMTEQQNNNNNNGNTDCLSLQVYYRIHLLWIKIVVMTGRFWSENILVYIYQEHLNDTINMKSFFKM